MQTFGSTGICNLHSSEAHRLDAQDTFAFSFVTRADEVGVVYQDPNGKIIGVWCDFNPHEKQAIILEPDPGVVARALARR